MKGGGGLAEGASEKTPDPEPGWECSQACGLHSQPAWIGIDLITSELCDLVQVPPCPMPLSDQLNTGILIALTI